MSARGPVLVVSASAGLGHVRAAEALAAALAAAGAEVEHVDVLSLAPRWVKGAYGGGFELLAARAPRLWRELYVRSDGETPDAARWGPLAARIMFGAFRRLLLSRPWQACLSTHFLPPQLMAGRCAPPFGLVITDFTLHRYWSQPRVREYFVATDALGREVHARVPAAQVHVTGIPVDPAFERAPDWRAARASLGLDVDRPVALVMGGGAGMGVEDAAAAALASPVPGLQVVAVCGRNEEAGRRLAALGDARLQAVGFRRDVPRLFAAADVVVTKPGGLTTSEALACGRPLLLTRAIPGHEEANASVLAAAGAARRCPDGRELTNALAAFFAEPATALRMSAAARRLGAPDAARRIVRSVLEYQRIPEVA